MSRIVLKDFSQLRAAVAPELRPAPKPRQVQPQRTQVERQSMIGTVPELEIEPGWLVEDCKTIEELDDARLRLTEIIASMESQLARAAQERRDTGQYADPVWWRRTQTALKFKRAAFQRVMNKAADLRRQRREATHHTRERAIIDALKAIDAAAYYRAIAVTREAHPDLFDGE